MIPPNEYSGWNPEAAESNHLMNQSIDGDEGPLTLQDIEKEFQTVVDALKENHIDVIVAPINHNPTPDAVESHRKGQSVHTVHSKRG